MPRIRLRRPSAALVVSTVSLIVALGGTSYAAFTLPQNSVGTKQLKNGAVTTKKLASDATVSDALHANSADAATNAAHAASADTATNASHASDASTVGGQPSSAFVPASRFISSNGVIKLTGTASGNSLNVIRSGPFTITVTCSKTGGNVTETLDAASTDAGSDIGTFSHLDSLGPSSSIAESNHTIDMAAPSGAALDFVYSMGINGLGSDCFIHFVGFS